MNLRDLFAFASWRCFYVLLGDYHSELQDERFTDMKIFDGSRFKINHLKRSNFKVSIYNFEAILAYRNALSRDGRSDNCARHIFLLDRKEGNKKTPDSAVPFACFYRERSFFFWRRKKREPIASRVAAEATAKNCNRDAARDFRYVTEGRRTHRKRIRSQRGNIDISALPISSRHVMALRNICV